MIHIVLRVNCDYFPIYLSPNNLYSRDIVCCVRKLIFMYSADKQTSRNPCHGSGAKSPASKRGDLPSIPRQSMWDFWWRDWHRDKFFSEYFVPLSVSSHRSIHIYMLLLAKWYIPAERGSLPKCSALSEFGQHWMESILPSVIQS